MQHQKVGLLPHHVKIFLVNRSDDFTHFLEYNLDNNKEYSEKSIREMQIFYRELLKFPNTEIEFVDKSEKDYLCSNLCNNFINGECQFDKIAKQQNIKDNISQDIIAQRIYDLAIGKIKTVKELLELAEVLEQKGLITKRG